MAAIDVDVSGYDNWMPKEHSEAIFDFLKSHDAHWWHGIALTWNWDRGEAPLAWIAQQPDCDRTTAVCMFWLSDPAYHFSTPEILTRSNAELPSPFRLAKLIAGNLGKRFYGNYGNERFGMDSKVCGCCDYNTVRRFYEGLAEHPQEGHWGHTLMFPRTWPGEPYDYSRFEEGIPRNVARSLGIIK